MLLLELHHSGCSLRRPCNTHCCELLSRSRHAYARILRRRRPLDQVRLLLWLLGPLLSLLLLLKHLPLLEKILLSALKFSLTHLLPLQLVLQGGHTLACSVVRRCWLSSSCRSRLLLLLLLLKLCLVELQLLLLLPESRLLLGMQAALRTHRRLPGETLRYLCLQLVTAGGHCGWSPLDCLLWLRQGGRNTAVGSLPLLLLLEVGPLHLLLSGSLLLRHRAG